LFSEFRTELQKPLFKALTEKPFKYETLSAVQEAVLNVLPQLTGRLTLSQDDVNAPKDLLVKAKTGTGKTLAFLVPAMQAHLSHVAESESLSSQSQSLRGRVSRTPPTVGCLILSPTRELATQIADEAGKLLFHTRDTPVHLFVGGASKGMQIRDWQYARGSGSVVVATPGRMLDLLENVPGIKESFANCRTLIMDEADTLLDMGFEQEIQSITDHLPPKESRQTFMFSATVSPAIRNIARKTLKKNHLFIDTVAENESNVHEHVPQYYTVLESASQQLPHILQLVSQDMMQNPKGGKTIIFLPTTKMTMLFGYLLIQMKRYLPFKPEHTYVSEIHSKKSQAMRDRNSQNFRDSRPGRYSILVTSDVSARGVDYPGVTRVIQIGCPTSRDIYIHRVGRTGRAGKSGRGDLVLLPWESAYVSTELKGFPLKSLSVSNVETENKELVQEARASSLNSGLERRYEELLPSLANFQQEINPEEVEEAFLSLLGYYVTKSDLLKLRPSEIVQGLKTWAKDGAGTGQEPYVSESFLQKIGGGSNSRRERRPVGSQSGASVCHSNMFN